MASGINSGNYYSNLNSQLAAKGPDKAAVETARQTSGDAAQTAKSNTSKHSRGEGVQLSDKAMKSLQTEHAENMKGHEHELAEHAGLQEYEGDNAERQEIRKERNSEAYQHEVAEGQEGKTRVQSPTGAEQFLDAKQEERLTVMDDIDRHDPLADIPDANLRAADQVFATQATKGLKPLAQLKPVPEAEVAADLEVAITPPLSEPMGIREPGNDRTTQPMQLELPPETERIAAEQAALKLQQGEVGEQMIIGAPGMNGTASTNGAAKVAAPVAEPLDPAEAAQARQQRDEAQTYLDTTLKNYLTSVEKLKEGHGQAVSQYIADVEGKFSASLSEGGKPVDKQVVHYAAIGQAAQDEIDVYRKNVPEIANLLDRHSKDGQLDTRTFYTEASQMAESYARQGNKDMTIMLEDAACCSTLVAASSQYLEAQSKLAGGGEGPLPIKNGKLDLDVAGVNPATRATIEGLRSLTENDAWRTRQASAEGLSAAYQQLEPEQQATLRSRVDRHISMLEDDDSSARDKKKKKDVDTGMVWAEEMEQWSAATLSQAAPDDPQRTLLQNIRNQAEGYRLLRNVMDEKGWG